MKHLLTGLLVLGFAVAASAADEGILKDFDSLSGNDVLMDRAAQLSPDIKTQVVQKRAVTRPGRFEFVTGYTSAFGGDAYVKTQMIGAGVNYHLNYRWSVGLRYDYAYNDLTQEGKNLIENPTAVYDNNGNFLGYGANVPALDYIKDSKIATVNWYPIYGKFSLVDKAVVHFDMYALAGGGSLSLRNGSTSALTAGAGMAFWFSQHLTSRLEVKWLGYDAERVPGTKDAMNVTTGQLSLGYLL